MARRRKKTEAPGHTIASVVPGKEVKTVKTVKAVKPAKPVEPAKPVSDFKFISSEIIDGGIEERTYALDMRGNGALVRTVWMKGEDVVSVSMVHVTNMGIREGKLVRSLR